MQRILHASAEFLVGAGDDAGGQRVLRHFPGQVGTGQHADAGLGRDFLEDLAHQHEALGFDALGGTHQQLAAQRLGHRLQCLAQRTGRQRHEDQFAGGQHLAQVAAGLHVVMDPYAAQITRILPLATHRFRLHGVPHPQARDLAVFRQQIGNGRAEASPAQHRNGLSFCHSSLSSHLVAMAHYTERCHLGQSHLARGTTVSVNMPAFSA